MEQLPLKDIHLPEPIGFWPPPSGWWLLAGLLVVVGCTVWYLHKKLRLQTELKTARRLLAELRQNHMDNPLQTLADVSALLRRVAISRAPRSEVASLTGQAWLAYLDKPFQDAPFSQGVGRCLADAHYRQNAASEPDFDELFKLCERWLKQQNIYRATPRARAGSLPRGKA